MRRSRVYREQQALHLLAQASVRFVGMLWRAAGPWCSGMSLHPRVCTFVQGHVPVPPTTCVYCTYVNTHSVHVFLSQHLSLSLSDLMAFKVVSQCSKQFCLSHVGFWKGGCYNPLSLAWLCAVHALVRVGSIVVTRYQKETFLCNWLLFKIPGCWQPFSVS